MRARVGAAAVVVIGMLSLTGCAPDPDIGPLQAELEGIDGVNGVQVSVQHSGAPWNTSIVVGFYLDDPTDAALTEVVEEAVPALAADATASTHPIAILFYDGALADYDRPGEQTGDKVLPGSAVYDALGLDFGGGESVRLTPDDLARLEAS